MAKALLGYVGGPDSHMLADIRRLEERIQDLEAELVRVRKENDALAAKPGHDLLAEPREPAHT